MKKIAIVISPNWRDYAKKYIDEMAESLRKQRGELEIKIFITDNESSDESFYFLKKSLLEACIIRSKSNGGYAKGCNDSIRKAIEEKFDYIAVFSIHAVLEPDCIKEMIKVARSDDNIAFVQALMMLHNQKNKVSSLGNSTHFLGFGYCEGYKKELPKDLEEKDIFYPSGSSILARREIWEKVGLFDEEFWMYNEDQEIGWRAWLMGYRCVLAPKALMYNKFDFLRSIKKYYWMDRNRILAILFCYSLPALILIAPAFILMEIGLILFSFKTGWFAEKIKVWKYFLSIKNWKYIIKRRRENQKSRIVKDREIVRLITGRIWYQEVDDWKLRLINPIFSLYWRSVRVLLDIFDKIC